MLFLAVVEALEVGVWRVRVMQGGEVVLALPPALRAGGTQVMNLARARRRLGGLRMQQSGAHFVGKLLVG